jgi:SAM-dependent methyltransferase
MKLYKDLAEYYYEIEKPGRNIDEEIRFLATIIRNYKLKTAIDFGCGSGEHVNALKPFLSIKGVDISNEMVAVAKKRFPESEFFVGDLRSFKFEKPVDSVICMFGTFNYMIEESEIIESLTNLTCNLNPSGIAVLEVWSIHPIQKIKRKPISPVSLSRFGDLMIKRNRGFKISSSSSGIENLVEVNFIFNLDQKIIKDKHLMRVFSESEFKELLLKANLKLIHNFGNFKMEDFTHKTGRMLLVCRKIEK